MLGAAFLQWRFSTVFTKTPSNFIFLFFWGSSSSSSSLAPFIIIIIGRCAFLRTAVSLVREHRCDHYCTAYETKRGTRQNTKAAHCRRRNDLGHKQRRRQGRRPPRRSSHNNQRFFYLPILQPTRSAVLPSYDMIQPRKPTHQTIRNRANKATDHQRTIG